MASKSQKKSHSTKGILKVLDLSLVYKAYQWICGDYKVYGKFLEPVFDLSNQRNITILDIGCGNGNVLNYLPSNINYVGYDFNKDYINKAKSKFESGNIKFLLVDINNSDPEFETNFDFILAIGILHHVDDEACRSLFRSAAKKLKQGGLFMSIDPVYIEDQNPIARFLISRDRGKAIRTSAQIRELQGEYFTSIEHKIHNNLGNIPFSHITTNCKN